jgi:hypothetical protein
MNSWSLVENVIHNIPTEERLGPAKLAIDEDFSTAMEVLLACQKPYTSELRSSLFKFAAL